MSSTTWQDLIEAANRAATVDDLHRVCARICDQYGYDYFIYAAQFPTSLVRPHLVILSGYPDDWREHYTARGYVAVDPTVAYCRAHITPLEWSRIDTEDDGVVRTFMREAESFGLKSGASFPVHGSQGESAMLSMACTRPQPVARKTIMESLPFAHLLATHVHEAVRRVFDAEELLLGPVQLTERERESLLWAAEGKSADEIGTILGIAERTVVFHLQNASRKLGVTNRRQAVARAVSLGVIRPALPALARVPAE